MKQKPLQGIKVVELATYVAAPACPRILGDWGAEVIKIEAPGGDPGRRQPLILPASTKNLSALT